MGYFDRDRNGEKMMKVVIDIPEKAYSATRNRFSEHNMDDIEYLFIEFWIETVRNGTPIPDNATNGEVLISLYPNLKYTIQNGRVITTIGVASSFDLDWWNGKYKAESEE